MIDSHSGNSITTLLLLLILPLLENNVHDTNAPDNVKQMNGIIKACQLTIYLFWSIIDDNNVAIRSFEGSFSRITTVGDLGSKVVEMIGDDMMMMI